ncbi:MAG: hypothetical protein HYU30_08190 [Chloroflexi bacterium]|nr:hypothetical protein [Chloroflexota bacterium]
MVWLKGCPKCRGELTDNKDTYGYYIYCVQCGYHLTEAQIGKLWTHTLNRKAGKPAPQPQPQQHDPYLATVYYQ